jgi:replication factor A1
LSTFQPKNGGPAKDKRSLQICDESGLAIQLTLWGRNATKLQFQEGQVLAVRGARVSDYGGKTLNSGDEHSQIFVDMNNKRTKELKEWYESKNPA